MVRKDMIQSEILSDVFPLATIQKGARALLAFHLEAHGRYVPSLLRVYPKFADDGQLEAEFTVEQGATRDVRIRKDYSRVRFGHELSGQGATQGLLKLKEKYLEPLTLKELLCGFTLVSRVSEAHQAGVIERKLNKPLVQTTLDELLAVLAGINTSSYPTWVRPGGMQFL